MRQSKLSPVSGAILAGILLLSGMGHAENKIPVSDITPVAATGYNLAPSSIPQNPIRRAAVQLPDDRPLGDFGEELGPLGLPCDATMTAKPAAGATVVLRVETPCLPSARVRIKHGDLAADYFSSSSGITEATFPATQELAVFEAHLPTGDILTAQAQIPEAVGYERMVTMWRGPEGLSVHAFEFGATEGDAGHVWRGAARMPEVADTGRGGFLLSLGSGDWPDGLKAEVYSFPVSEAVRSGLVQIALGAEVTPNSCGQELHAVTLQIGDGLPGAPVDISLQLPACDSETRFMLLKNLARDLKVSSN